MPLILDLHELEEALGPVLAGEVGRAAFDTETTEVKDERFTPFGTDSRICGFSASYDHGGREVDLYAAVRHQPYDWRRSPELMAGDAAHHGPEWLRRLREVERISEAGRWVPGHDPNLPLEGIRALWRRMMGAPCTWYAHNWPFDARMLLVEGIQLPWERLECTQALSVFTDERPLDLWDDDAKAYLHGGHALKHLGEVHLDIPADAQDLLEEAKHALGPGGRKLQDYSMLPLKSALAPYACMDTRLVLRLAACCEARDAYQDPRIRKLLWKHRMERPLAIAMEQRGMPVNQGLARERRDLVETEVARLTARTHEQAGIALNLGHGETLAQQLYGELGLPVWRGIQDTRAATLKRVRAGLVADGMRYLSSGLDSEAAARLLDLILAWRKATKELTAFYRPLTCFGETGRVHTILSPLGARTTRFAAAKPNTMQMSKPRKGKTPEEARANQEASVRHLFQPPEGMCFLLVDYSSQEMRVSAHYAVALPYSFDYRFTWTCTMGRRGSCKGGPPHGPKGDVRACRGFIHTGRYRSHSTRPKHMGLVEGFLNEGTGFDPHQAMVSWCEREGLGISRDEAKTAVYAILYGAGVRKLAETLDCSEEVAKRLIGLFWERAYPELDRVRLFIQEKLRQTEPRSQWSGQGYITTLYGGRIHLAGSYKGLNYLVQRSCREILLEAELTVQEYLKEQGAADIYRMVLPLHDELIFEVPENELDQGIVQGIAIRMVQAGKPSLVPMVVEPAVARKSWAVKEPLPADWGCDGVELYHGSV